mmetsp:Transcript_21051/g.32119  ORF Transcript_21051/g.32119 Transcript_21051/m.32119 type:complete len:85 (-) Transcript_21051:538-792(-)
MANLFEVMKTSYNIYLRKMNVSKWKHWTLKEEIMSFSFARKSPNNTRSNEGMDRKDINMSRTTSVEMLVLLLNLSYRSAAISLV